LDIDIASWTEATREPTRRPDTAYTPKKIPVKSGVKITKAPGGIVSFREAFVEMAMQAS
jgi:hypothetical protein